MNLQFVTHAIGAARLALKAKAPTIMVVSGVTAMTAGTVVACKQTLKIDGILEEHVPELEKIEKGEELLIPSYTPEDAQSRSDQGLHPCHRRHGEAVRRSCHAVHRW